MRSQIARVLFGLLAFVFIPSCSPTAHDPDIPAPQTVQELETTSLDVGGGVKLEMVRIPAGKFMMGSPKSERGRRAYEFQHEVIISQPFYIGKYEVTQEQYEAVTGKSHPRRAWVPNSIVEKAKVENTKVPVGNVKATPTGSVKGSPIILSERMANLPAKDTRRFPVENVSWEDALDFCRKLNAKHAREGYRFDLPTEAQWEYACRAGTKTPFHFGNKLNGQEANCNGYQPYGASKQGPYLEWPYQVGTYEPNAWGLYDMHGNVSEWCKDMCDGWALLQGRSGTNATATQTDPRGPGEGPSRVVRGGGCSSPGGECRSAYRSWRNPTDRIGNLGFRLALVPVK